MITRSYITLSGIFVACIICGNLTFQKFVTLPLWDNLELSGGILPYPLTFLVTDLICEVYGKKPAQDTVFAGIVASILVAGIVWLADCLPATPWAPVDDVLFHKVFGVYGLAFLSSLIATIAAQFLDIHVFHFWKQVTRGKHLWLRNNVSTILSQALDSFCVLLLLGVFGIIPLNQLSILFMHAFSFKVLCGLLDTPFCYAGVYLLKRQQRHAVSSIKKEQTDDPLPEKMYPMS